MMSLASMLVQPEVIAAAFALLALVLALLLWRHMGLLAEERERNREAGRVVSLFEDVGGFQRAERGLHAAIEGLPDAFVLYDPEDRLVLCNSRYRELYADSADVIRVGNRFEDMLRIGVARGQYAQALDDPEAWIAERLAKHRSPPKAPIEQRLGDGRWLRVCERRMPDGHTVGFRIDITELKRRESALRLSEGRLAAVVSGALDAIMAVDPDGRLTEFNPAAERVFGFRRDEVIGRRAGDLLVPLRHRAAYDRRIGDVLARGPRVCAGGGERIEARSLRADGSEILTEIAFNCVEGHDGPMVIGFIRDITEERARMLALRDALARAEAADRAKSDFLAMMSHEIRTPLNAVIGLLDLMLEEGLAEHQQERAVIARGSAEALLQIVNDILDFSRLEARRIEFVEVPFDARDLVTAVGDLLAPRARAKGLDLSVGIGDEVPAVLVGDAGRLRQILINLVGNAVKFTAGGHVRVSLSLRGPALPPRDGLDRSCWPVRFSVEDTGHGIPPDQREGIFERYRTLATPDGRRGEGVGLGLAICRELASGMGGRIALEEAASGGCRFVVDLDLAEGDAAAGRPARRELPPDQAEVLRGAVILLAEDNATNRMLAENLLKGWGCRLRAVHDGEEAVAALESGRFDVVLMDVSMPGMSGHDAARRIRSGTGPNRTVPIVALTAHALPGERDKALAAGMDGFVTKPVDAPELARTLVALLRRDAPQAGGRGSAAGTADRSAGAGVDLIDRAQFDLTMADLPVERRAMILARCVKDLRLQAEDLRARPQDRVAVISGAHVLGGLAETFGAERLARHARRLERAGGAGAGPDAAAVLAHEAEAAAAALEMLGGDMPLPARAETPVGPVAGRDTRS